MEQELTSPGPVSHSEDVIVNWSAPAPQKGAHGLWQGLSTWTMYHHFSSVPNRSPSIGHGIDV